MSDRTQQQITRDLITKAESNREPSVYVPAYGAPLEHAITRALIAAMDRAGFVPVAVWDSEVYAVETGEVSAAYANHAKKPWVPDESMVVSRVLDAVFAVDADCTIHFAPRDALSKWGGLGVLVIQGNGIDFISDWHVNRNFPSFNDALDVFTKVLGGDAYALTITTNIVRAS